MLQTSVPVAAWAVVTTIATVAEAPFAIVPRLQVNVPLHEPWLGVAETSVEPVGSTSIIVTLVASAGPPLCTVTR